MGNVANNQLGFTLLELMVALTIGTVLLLGAGTVADLTGKTSRYQRQLTVLNDNGRYALDRLVQDVRTAGFRRNAWAAGAMDDALEVQDGATDTLTVRYEADFDCAGVPTAAPGFVATNVFDVVAGRLRCNGELVAPGVEEFQVFVGEDTDGDGVPNRFVSPGTPGVDFTRVTALQLHVLMNSAEGRLRHTEEQFFFGGDNEGRGGLRVYNDGLLRREYATLLTLRNR